MCPRTDRCELSRERSRLISLAPAPTLPPSPPAHLQATADLNQERSARLSAEQAVLKLRGELDAISQVGAAGAACAALRQQGRGHAPCSPRGVSTPACLHRPSALPAAPATSPPAPQAEEMARIEAQQSLKALQGEYETAKVSSAAIAQAASFGGLLVLLWSLHWRRPVVQGECEAARARAACWQPQQAARGWVCCSRQVAVACTRRPFPAVPVPATTTDGRNANRTPPLLSPP